MRRFCCHSFTIVFCVCPYALPAQAQRSAAVQRKSLICPVDLWAWCVIRTTGGKQILPGYKRGVYEGNLQTAGVNGCGSVFLPKNSDPHHRQ